MFKYSQLSVVGIEIEYMIVNKFNLNIFPHSDWILKDLAANKQIMNEVEINHISASNELVMHVLELKNTDPLPINAPLVEYFQQAINKIIPILNRYQAALLPTGAHPWMDPNSETQRWPHDNADIYQKYDEIFNCQGHGWSNLQSMHVNLPFANDKEFALMHNSIRILLPLLPALAASSPFVGGKYNGYKCLRLYFYGINQQKIPQISGDIIPELISNQKEYENRILIPMYKAIEPFDSKKILQHEWLNSRGAIAKFEYGAIEIRIIDPQECVSADIAIAKVIYALIKYWIRDDYFLSHPCSTKKLKAIFDQAIKFGLDHKIDDSEIMNQWQLPKKSASLRSIWDKLIEKTATDLDQQSLSCLEFIIHNGSLSDRLLQAAGKNPRREKLFEIYKKLQECLELNQMFIP